MLLVLRPVNSSKSVQDVSRRLDWLAGTCTAVLDSHGATRQSRRVDPRALRGFARKDREL